MFGNKNTFGTTSTFGSSSPFGSNQPAFGQSGSTFANKPTGFASPFGSATGTSIFGGGSSTQPPGGLFGSNATAPAFGQTTTSTGTGFGAFGGGGTSLFGQTTQPQSTQSGGLFGTSTGTSLFGTQNKPAFGSTFGTSAPSGGIFGQPQQQPSLFGQNMQSASLFGASTAFGGAAGLTGTTIKFNPPTGTDTMMKNGVSTQISTRHQCITCMKEYENKSLEELRGEDYSAGRKGSTSAPSLGFSGTTSLFGSSTPAGMFGQQQQQAKPAFGPTGAFGTATTAPSLFGQQQPQQQTTSFFGQSTPAFGPSTTSTGFTFGNQNTTSLFGQSKFGATTQPSLFGGTSQPSVFGGTGSTFGTQQQQQPGSLFGQKPPVFGAATTTGFTFGTNTQTQSSIFGNKPTGFGTPFGSGTSTSTGFGTATQSIFGKPGTTPNFNFGNTTTSAFGNTGFGTSGNTGGTWFGNTANKTTAFGTGSTFGTGTFGSGTSGGFFGSPGTGFPTGSTAAPFGSTTGQLQGNSQSKELLQQQILSLAVNPFGDSPLFRNILKDTGKRDELLKPTNPAAQQAFTGSPSYKIGTQSSPVVRPKPMTHSVNGKVSLFDDIEDERANFGQAMFVPRQNIKKLVIKPQPSQSSSTSSTREKFPVAASPSRSQKLLTVPISDSSDMLSPDNSICVPTVDSTLDTPATVVSRSGKSLRSSGGDEVLENTVSEYNARRPDLQRTEADITLDESQQSVNELQEDDENIQPHPAGITLRRPGYYTIPSLEELASSVDSTGKCIVSGFTIGREGFGSITFDATFDVANLNLDEIVHIRRKQVIVYPYEEKKAPIGEGLNRKAEITLDKVWPADKTTREPIASPERLQVLHYAEKVEAATHRLGARFIDYRPETGSWVFEVQHFSKYGLEEEDEEVEEPIQQPRREQMGATGIQHTPPPPPPPNSQMQTKIPPLKIPKSTQQANGHVHVMNGHRDMAPLSFVEKGANVLQDSEEDEIMDDPDCLQDTATAILSPPSHKFAARIGAIPDRVQAMKASFFCHEGEEDDLQIRGFSPLGHPGMGKPFARDLLTLPTRRLKKPSSVSSSHDDERSTSFGSDIEEDEEDSEDKHLFSFNPPQIQIEEEKKSGSDEEEEGDSKFKPDFNFSAGEKTALKSPFIFSAPFQPSPLPSGTLFKEAIVPPHISGKEEERREVMQDHPRLVVTLPKKAERELRKLPRLNMNFGSSVPSLKSARLSSKVRSTVDMGCSSGRSFCVGWGPRQVLLVPKIRTLSGAKSKRIQQKPMSSGAVVSSMPYSVLVQKLMLPHGDEEPTSKAIHSRMLEVQLLHTTISNQHGSPSACPMQGADILHALQEVLKDLIESAKVDLDREVLLALKVEMEIWRLCVALWGKSDIFGWNERKGSHANEMARREAVSQWLKEVNKNASATALQKIGKDMPTQMRALREFLVHLCNNDSVEAFKAAKQAGVPELGKLMGRNGMDGSVRDAALHQLSLWLNNRRDTDVTLVQVHSLMAGIPTWVTSSQQVMNVCDGLTWRQCFSLHLWYMNPGGTLPETVKMFDDGYSGRSRHGIYMEPPYPHYHDEIGREIFDMAYHLLKLYADKSHRLELLLDPNTLYPNLLDHRMSWLLWAALESQGYHHLSETSTYNLIVSYANELETLGLWEWAVFILMHIPHTGRRKQVIQQLLDRNVSIEDTNEDAHREGFLISQLQIPRDWVYAAKACKAHALQRWKEEAVYLLQGGQLNRSHELIVHHIAPKAILEGDEAGLKALLTELRDHEKAREISDWDIGGQLILDFINLTHELQDALVVTSPGKVKELQPVLTSVSARLLRFPPISPLNRECKARMASVLTGLVQDVLASENPRTSHSAYSPFSLSQEFPQTAEDHTGSGFLLQLNSQLMMCDSEAVS